MKYKKFIFDISVDAWINNIEIEAESRDEALEELLSMSLTKIIDKGHVKSFEVSNIDTEVEEPDEEDEEDIEEDFSDDEEDFKEDDEEFVDDTEDDN